MRSDRKILDFDPPIFNQIQNDQKNIEREQVEKAEIGI